MPRGQVVYFFFAFVVLVYFVAQAVVLFYEDAVRKIELVQVAFMTVHTGVGVVIMLPVLAISFFPLFVDLQTRMLFNEDFSSRRVQDGGGFDTKCRARWPSVCSGEGWVGGGVADGTPVVCTKLQVKYL